MVTERPWGDCWHWAGVLNVGGEVPKGGYALFRASAGRGRSLALHLERVTMAEDRLPMSDERHRVAASAEQVLDQRGLVADDRSPAPPVRPVVDRGAADPDRRAAVLDDLTGAYRRSAGLLEIVWEVARAKRTSRPLVLAFIDVDGLHAPSDATSAASADELLQVVAETLRANLRPGDLIVRFGVDEFLCAMSGLTLDAAASRFKQMNVTLASRPEAVSVSVGLAELRGDESLSDAVARADTESHRSRHQR